MKTKKIVTNLDLALQALNYAIVDYQREFVVDAKVVKKAKEVLQKMESNLPSGIEAISQYTIRLIWGDYEVGVNINPKECVLISKQGQYIFEKIDDLVDNIKKTLEV